MAVIGNAYSEFTREWLNRLVGELLGLAGLWLVVGVIILHARPALQWINVNVTRMYDGKALLALLGATALVVAVLIVVWRRLNAPRQPIPETEQRQPGLALLSWLAVL